MKEFYFDLFFDVIKAILVNIFRIFKSWLFNFTSNIAPVSAKSATLQNNANSSPGSKLKISEQSKTI